MNKIKEIKYISDYLNISKEILEKAGAFNSIIGIDSKLFVDPVLLKKTTILELKDSYKKIQAYFNRIFLYISKYQIEKDEKTKNKIYNTILSMFRFPEIPNTFLGFSSNSDKGTGVGKGLAKDAIENAIKVYEMGINDPVYFELLPIFEKEFGKDRISDLIINIIKEDLKNYSKRIANDNSLKYEKDFIYKNNNELIILIPKEILVTEQASIDLKNKIERRIKKVSNEEQRQKMNFLAKENIQAAIEEYAQLSNEKQSYDFINDAMGINNWPTIAQKIIQSNLLNSEEINKVKNLTLFEKTKYIINLFKDLVKNNKLYENFYNQDENGKTDFGKPKYEKAIQRLLYGVAYYFCKTYKIDLSPETNAGSGPVDFKTSQNGESIVIELKIAKSLNQLVHGYSIQLEQYKKAEKTEKGIFVIILLSDNNKKTREKFNKFLEKDNFKNQIPTTEIIVIDATSKKSASKK